MIKIESSKRVKNLSTNVSWLETSIKLVVKHEILYTAFVFFANSSSRLRSTKFLTRATKIRSRRRRDLSDANAAPVDRLILNTCFSPSIISNTKRANRRNRAAFGKLCRYESFFWKKISSTRISIEREFGFLASKVSRILEKNANNNGGKKIGEIRFSNRNSRR